MNNSYFSRMNNVGYNQLFMLLGNNQKFKLMRMQIKRLNMLNNIISLYQVQNNLIVDFNQRKIHNLNLLRENLNLLRIRKVVLLQI